MTPEMEKLKQAIQELQIIEVPTPFTGDKTSWVQKRQILAIMERIGFPVPDKHHVWCNGQKGDVETCRWCGGPKGAWALYPYDPEKGPESDFTKKYFPNVLEYS